MNHNFIPSQADGTICARCKFDAIAHTDHAICAICNQEKIVEIYNTMLFCPECIIKEQEAEKELKATEKDRINQVESQGNINQLVIENARAIDDSIRIRPDLFNAHTVAIAELKQAIYSDTTLSLQQQHWKLAQEIDRRLKHHQIVLFDLREKELEVASQFRAEQLELSQLSSKLRADQREKLKIEDINYKPIAKKISKPSAPSKKKFDKIELRKYANQFKIPEAMLQTVVVAKNLSVKDAARHCLKMLNRSE